MAMENKRKLYILIKEIDNLVALLVKVDEGSEPVDTLTGQKQKVLDLLPVTPDDGRAGGTYPMHKLLACEPLTQTKIPLDVLEKLIESCFNVNSQDNKFTEDEHCFYVYNIRNTCLNLAIENEHYDAVRWLVQHGADCDIGTEVHDQYEKKYGYSSYTVTENDYIYTTPIAELARKANAPFDLFNLLATPKSLNDDKCNSTLPLEHAIKEGNTENALRLIKLGSTRKSKIGPMIHAYLAGYPKQYHDELFTRLIPSETIDILTCVDKVLTMYSQEDNYTKHEEETEANDGEQETEANDSEQETEANDGEQETEANDGKQESEANTMTSPPIKYQMLNRLFQYIIPTDQMCICFEKDYWERLEIKMNRVTFSQIYSSQHVYWWSLLLVNLSWHFKSTPQSIVPLQDKSASKEDVQLAHRIDDIWKTYRDTCSVISLQNLCIQQTRRSMRNFSDDSFMSLPVPNNVRNLLMYQHVAEIACEAASCKMKKV